MTQGTDAAVKHRRIRIALLVAGGVMWVAVFVVLFRIWKERREAYDPADDPAAPQPYKLPDKFPSYALPEFELTECRGGTVSKTNLQGRPWVASFIFTRCRGECPKVIGQLQKLRDSLADSSVRLVTISVDPEHDTPEVLQRYAENLNADRERWLFLTGEQDEIYRLVQQGFKLSVKQNTGEERSPGNEVGHSQSVLLVNAEGVVVGKFNGTSELEMLRLRREIERLAEVHDKVTK